MDTAPFDRIAWQCPLYREELLRVEDAVKDQAFDIRFRTGQPVSICGREGVFFLRAEGGTARALTEALPRVSPAQMQELFLHLCAHSVFSHEGEIRKGFVKFGVSGRAGICGTAVLEDGRIKSVRDVSTVVLRIPREKKGCADRLFLENTDFLRGVLVVGEPSSGKTTFLRDLICSLSAGKFFPSRRVAVLDEQGELGGSFDLGPCADVLSGYPKEVGFDIAIRMLSPEIVVCDELSPGDLDAVRRSAFAGVSLIASVHASRRDLYRRRLCRELLESGAFQTAVCLSGRDRPCEIEAIERVGEEDEDPGGGDGVAQRSAAGALEGGRAEKTGEGIA